MGDFANNIFKNIRNCFANFFVLFFLDEDGDGSAHGHDHHVVLLNILGHKIEHVICILELSNPSVDSLDLGSDTVAIHEFGVEFDDHGEYFDHY